MEGIPTKRSFHFPKIDVKEHLHTLMILYFNVLSNDYEEKILNCHDPIISRCPKCGAKHRFHRHGTYLRHITYISSDGSIKFEVVKILRLKCQSCNSTHSILPIDIIPFQVYSLPTLLFIYEQILLNKQSIRSTARKTECSIQTIYQKLNLLKQNLNLIELYLRQLFLYTEVTPLCLAQAITFLILPTMDFSSYFYYHRHPIFLKRRNTISYSLYFEMAFS